MSEIEKESLNIGSPFGGQGAIFLIGFMGSGKTYWGNKWSALSGKEFIDLDDVVEKEEGKTIAAIFTEHGEEHFRGLESKVLRNLIDQKNVIIANGGGTPCYDDNISWMNKNGVSVYLRSAPENILKRLQNEKEKRPLIKNLNNDELLFYITEKIKERELFYKQAKIILNVDDLQQDYLPDFLNI